MLTMPHRMLSLEEAAAYLHIGADDLDQMVRGGTIPFERKGDRVCFVRRELDAWASHRILGLPDKKLQDYHRGSSHRTATLSAEGAIMPGLIRAAYIHPEVSSRTKHSVLRDMTALADGTGLVLDARGLIDSLVERERMCSTGLPGGLALLHPRHHEPYMFESSFLVFGRTVQAVPFGAIDGTATDLFFLLCCQDDRMHLHALARICLMVHTKGFLAGLRDGSDAAAIYAHIVGTERSVIPGGGARRGG
jgi:PTS system nitrogen regulatory IIA component